MKLIYIAAPWKDRDLMNDIALKFEKKGFVITHKWWLVENLTENERSAELLQQQALADVAGVLNAKVLVLLNTAKSEGKAVEQGIALASGIPIAAIGKRGDGTSLNVFHYMSDYSWFDSVEDFLGQTN